MARPSKSLAERVRSGSFRARHHHELLAGDPVPWPELAELQVRYAAAVSEFEQRAIAREFGQLAGELRVTAARRRHAVPDACDSDGITDLDKEIQALGPPGSAERVINFFPRFFTHEDGRPFVLEDWQQWITRDLYSRDAEYRRIFKEGYFGAPRGQGKTPLSVGYGLEKVVREGSSIPRVFQGAGSKDQAAVGIEFGSRWVEDSDLADLLTIKARTISRRFGRGFYTIVSADGRLFHARKPDVALLDELWLYKSEREVQVHVAATSALHKEPDSFVFGASTAGYDLNSLLGQLYTKALACPEVKHYREGFHFVAKDVDNGFLMHWYGLPDGYELDLEDDKAVLKALRLANPGSWVDTRELLRMLRRTTDVPEWIRLALNGWTKTKGTWLPAGCWAGLRSEGLEIPPGADVWVGVDVGISHDTTAVVIAWRLEDGRTALKAHVWSARDKVPHHEFVRGGRMEIALVEQHLRELAHRYTVREVAYDPRFFERSAQMLSEEGFLLVELAQASGTMADAYQGFYQAAIEGDLVHDGDRVFAAHVEGTAAEKTDRGWRIRKLNSVNDACTAAAMAAARAAVGESAGGGIEWWDDDEDEED